MIVHAGPENVFLQRDVAGGCRRTARAVEAAEVDTQIFRLGGPVAGQRQFHAATQRPAGIGRGAAGEARHGRANVADCEASGRIRHHPVERIADAPAHGRKPGFAGGAAAGTSGAGAGAIEAGPIKVAFEAEHEVAELAVVAEGAAGLAAIDAETGVGRAPIGTAPAAAAINAEIKAAPVIGHRGRRRRRLVERRKRQVGRSRGLRRQRDRQKTCRQCPLHTPHQSTV
jgi:hypothetical protein